MTILSILKLLNQSNIMVESVHVKEIAILLFELNKPFTRRMVTKFVNEFYWK